MSFLYRRASAPSLREEAPKPNPQHAPLCELCDKIDFRYYITHPMKPRSLGTWHSIKRTPTCPFCRLVVACIRNLPDAESLHSHTEIRICGDKTWKRCVATLGYDGARSEVYSNECDLKSMAERNRGGNCCRFLVYWHSSAASGEIQYVPPPEANKSDCCHGRIVRPERFDFRLGRRWLDVCEDAHPGCSMVRNIPSTPRPPNFRVIDVDKNEITAAPSGSHFEYTALTYVWGAKFMSIEMPRLLRKDLQTDEEGKEWAALPENLPLTISDAITVTRQLGFRYLWVDNLCIVQDDAVDQQAQMSRMDAVYRGASLTIAAASGLHANTGLPGVSLWRERCQSVEHVKGIRLSTTFAKFDSLFSNARDLPWNTRGWTFQEKLLSQRILLFTDEQVYFKCPDAIWMEDTALEADRLSTNVKRRDKPFGWVADRPPRDDDHLRLTLLDFVTGGLFKVQDPDSKLGFLPNYAAVVKEYTRRELTFQQDVLRAVQGILRTLNSAREGYFAGLPSQYLWAALHWKPTIGTHITCCDPSELDEAIPTWSWARWKFARGSAAYINCDLRSDSQQWKTSTILYPTKKKEKFNPVRAFGFGPLRVLAPDYRAQISDFGFVPRVTLSPVEPDLPGAARRRLQESGCLLELRSGKARFWTGRRIGSTRLDEPGNDDEVAPYELDDREGRCVGIVECPKWATRTHSGNDFVALSWVIPPMRDPVRDRIWESYLPGSESTGDNGGTTISKLEERKWEFVNVMLVDHAEGVHYRVALGRVIKTAWERADRTDGVFLVG